MNPPLSDHSLNGQIKKLWLHNGNNRTALNGRLWVQCPKCWGWASMRHVQGNHRLRHCVTCDQVWELQT